VVVTVADSLQLGEAVASVVDSDLGGSVVASSNSYSTRAPVD
jgi:hypothetical protein